MLPTSSRPLAQVKAAYGDKPSLPAAMRVAAWALTLLSFFPYAAVPVGANTNFPLSSAAAVVVLLLANRAKAVRATMALLAVPLVTSVLGGFIAGHGISVKALLTWEIDVLPLPAFAYLSMLNARVLVRPLITGLTISVIWAAAQLLTLPRGAVPFRAMYSLPGYSSWATSTNEYLLKTGRVFAQFPEPSVLAGSLAIATVMLLVVQKSGGIRRTWKVNLLVVAVCFALAASQSGSAVITVAVILVLLVSGFQGSQRGRGARGKVTRANSLGEFRGRNPNRSFSRQLWVIAGLGIVALAAARAVGYVTSSRSATVQNFSWGDRRYSIFAGISDWFDSAGSILFGYGEGNVTLLVQSGQLVLSTSFERITDLDSVLVRLLLEVGLPGTLVIVGTLVVPAIRGMFRAVGLSTTLFVFLVWIVASGLTMTYNAVSWTWAFLGMAIGLLDSGTETQAASSVNTEGA